MNEPVRTRLNPAVGPVGVTRIPAAGAFDLARLNRSVANRGSGQETVSKSQRINKRLERRAHLPVGRSQGPIELALRIITAADQRANTSAGVVDCDDRA